MISTYPSKAKTAAAPEKARPVFPSDLHLHLPTLPSPCSLRLLTPSHIPHTWTPLLLPRRLRSPFYLLHHTHHTPMESLLPIASTMQRICAPENAPDIASATHFQFGFGFDCLCVPCGIFVNSSSMPSLSGARQTGAPFALCTCSVDIPAEGAPTLVLSVLVAVGVSKLVSCVEMG